MSTQRLIRWGGAAAMFGGVLRTVASFSPSPEPGIALELLYLVIDLCLLFGLLGVYGSQHEHLGRSGFVGFLLAVTGMALITGPDATLGTVNAYPVGSLLVGIGLVCLGTAAWRAHTLPRWVSMLWVASTVLGLAAAGFDRDDVFVLAGVTFGLAFIGAGSTAWSDARRA